MAMMKAIGAYHYAGDLGLLTGTTGNLYPKAVGPGLFEKDQFIYNFENFFHPWVGNLIQQLNQTSVAGMLDPGFLGGQGQGDRERSGRPLPRNAVSRACSGERAI